MFGVPDFSKQGKRKAAKRSYLRSFASKFKKNDPKNLILMYDIPHARKKDRDWLRRQLINFEYVMVQKSVWAGPSPLPVEFLAYLKNMGLQSKFKTFKLAKPYVKTQSTPWRRLNG